MLHLFEETTLTLKEALKRVSTVRGGEENSQGETGDGSDGQEGNPNQGCGDN